MSIFDRFRSRSTNDAMQVAAAEHSVREFVYLDETSVYSLASSRNLPPAVTLTESTAGERSRTNTETDTGNAGIAKVDIQNQRMTKSTAGTQIERKYNVQATFDQLRTGLEYRMLLSEDRSPVDVQLTPSEDIWQILFQARAARLALQEDDLRRGSVLELQLELNAHHSYELSTTMSEFGQLVSGSSLVEAGLGLSNAGMVVEMGRLLERFLVGLVPVECRAVDHRLVVLNGSCWIVHTAVLDAYRGDIAIDTAPLIVVGVTDRQLYWKDTRRLLHSQLTFDAMLRIARPGLQASWSPVKLFDVMKRAIPTMDLSKLSSLLEHATPAEDETAADTARLKAAFVASEQLHRALARHHGIDANWSILDDLGDALESWEAGESSVGAIVAFLTTVADAFYSRYPHAERDPEVVADLRGAALGKYERILADSSMDDQPDNGLSIPTDPTNPRPYLETEFVALYW